MAVTLGIDFDARRAIGAVDEPAIRRSSVCAVERYGREALPFVRFPLVHHAVLVRVLFGTHDDAALVVLDAADLAVTAGRYLDARHRTVGARIGPGVFLAVVGARETNFLELLVRAVVLPAIDLAVPVLVD